MKMLIDHPYRLYSLWLSIREVGTLEYGDFSPHLLFLSIILNNFYHVLHYCTSFNPHSNPRLGTIIIPILQLRNRRLREDKSFPEFTQLVSSQPGFKPGAPCTDVQAVHCTTAGIASHKDHEGLTGAVQSRSPDKLKHTTGLLSKCM